ncbi:MAG: tetratricopeptide repeat protein [Myxococcota bacterium]
MRRNVFTGKGWAILPLLLLAWGSSGVRAQDGGEGEARSATDEQARTLFMAGRTYYAQGDYEMALESFRKAHDLSGHPELLMNVSLSAERLGKTEVAAEYLARYLDEAEGIQGRETLERRLTNLRRRLERERARAEEGAVEAPAEAEAPGEPGVWGIPTPAFIAYAVGAAGLLTFGTFGILTIVENNDLADGCGATNACTDDQLSTLRAYTITADVGLGLALAGAATGTLLFFLLKDDAEPEGPAAGPDVTVTPLLGPRSGGAAAHIRF